MEENRIPKMVLYVSLQTRLRGRPRNRWQDEVRENERIVGGEGWQEKVHNSEEWKKHLRTARNRRILHMLIELINYNLMGTPLYMWSIVDQNVVLRHTTVYTWHSIMSLKN